ncbi:hypothetical protein [Sphingobacterium rhinopitheci]|uniref:hypothetical protein n=1 Tax=Sphingobacterium rhinopitheci TaxID=2781960 RepID=UPI001F52004A|nr:hypothetical protein [Sphingobacterium rhinopitheci]
MPFKKLTFLFCMTFLLYSYNKTKVETLEQGRGAFTSNIDLDQYLKSYDNIIIELKEVQTAIISLKSNGNSTTLGFKPSKSPKVISGRIVGAGKVKGKWRTGINEKNKS